MQLDPAALENATNEELWGIIQWLGIGTPPGKRPDKPTLLGYIRRFVVDE